MPDLFADGILLAQFASPRPRPRTQPSSDPVPIPEEDENVDPIPGPSCEPLSLAKETLAKQVFPLLPQGLRDTYVRKAQQSGRAPVSELAWEMGATHDRGGLNSRDQRIDIYDPQKHASAKQVDWEHITRSEAYRFIADYREYRGGAFGVPHTPLATALATFIPSGWKRPIIESIFFPNAPLAGKGRRATTGETYAPAVITGVSDGDTVKVRVLRNGCATEEGSIRFAGIDTPEKFRSDAKFWPQHEAVMNLWKDRGLLREGEASRAGVVGALLANRMEYEGAVSSLVMKDFLNYAVSKNGKFFLEETYNRILKPGDESASCDAVTLYDIYLRSIWVLRVEPPTLITEYMENRLPELMGNPQVARLPAFGMEGKPADPKNGAELLTKYQPGGYEAQLAAWRRDGRGELADLLDPKKLPPPAQLYSKESTTKMAAAWRAFVARHPDRAGDINAAMVGVGAAYAYTKYRNDLTPAYLELSAVVQRERLGLWGDELVVLMDPNVRILNKETRRYEPYTIPADCIQ